MAVDAIVIQIPVGTTIPAAIREYGQVRTAAKIVTDRIAAFPRSGGQRFVALSP